MTRYVELSVQIIHPQDTRYNSVYKLGSQPEKINKTMIFSLAC